MAPGRREMRSLVIAGHSRTLAASGRAVRYCRPDRNSISASCHPDMNSSTPSRDAAPLLVVGSGIAGLLVALRAAVDGPVVVITKADLQEGSTRHAQGGLAAAIGSDDSTGAHLADTLAVGAGLSERTAALAMCAEAPAWVAELLALGVPFDREDGRLAL